MAPTVSAVTALSLRFTATPPSTSAIPTANPDMERKRQRIVLPGDPPSPISLPVGCTFHPRCPYALEKCKAAEPPLIPGDHDRTVRCVRLGEI